MARAKNADFSKAMTALIEEVKPMKDVEEAREYCKDSFENLRILGLSTRPGVMIMNGMVDRAVNMPAILQKLYDLFLRAEGLYVIK